MSRSGLPARIMALVRDYWNEMVMIRDADSGNGELLSGSDCLRPADHP